MSILTAIEKAGRELAIEADDVGRYIELGWSLVQPVGEEVVSEAEAEVTVLVEMVRGNDKIMAELHQVKQMQAAGFAKTEDGTDAELKDHDSGRDPGDQSGPEVLWYSGRDQRDQSGSGVQADLGVDGTDGGDSGRSAGSTQGSEAADEQADVGADEDPEVLKEFILAMDQSDDDLWAADNRPRTQYISKVLGTRITIKDVEAVLPGFRRVDPLAK